MTAIIAGVWKMLRWSESARFWIVVGCINVTIPVVAIWKTHTGDLNRTTAIFVCLVCFALANGVYLLSVWSRDRRMKRPRSHSRAIYAATLVIVAALSTTIYLNSYAPKNRYFALAMSNTPLESIQPVQRRILVELIRERAASSQKYQSAVAHFRPITPPLYSPESFRSTEAMDSTVRQLQQAFAIDSAYFDGLRRSEARFREEMEQADPQYLQSWLNSENTEEEAEASGFTLEGEWVQSVHDLYQYAVSHHQNILVAGETLTFSTSEVKAKFQELENTSKGLQQKMQSARTAQVKKQQQSAAKVSD